MNKHIFFLFLACFFLPPAFSQTRPDDIHADAVAHAAPDSAGNSILSLSGYFNANLTTSRDLVRAFYYWTATNISYDVENMFTFRSDNDPGKIIMRTLTGRKAVCEGYSDLFHELCESAGIESYVVLGYTRQNGQVVAINHAWVVARIDSGWYFFDPTWASGAIINGNFTRKFTGEYFMVKPAIFIRTHMPFDPVWQCLYCPLNSANFARGVMPKTDTCRFFSFPDTIAAYETLPRSGKSAATLRRVQQNGVTNNSIFEYLRYLHQNVEIDRANLQNELQNQKVNRFNEAVNHFNAASLLFNEYIDYWNHQFRPPRPDARIRNMIDTCNYHLASCRKILDELVPQEESLRQNKEMLQKSLRENQKHVDDQEAFLRDYFATSKAYRPSLFRKYTWMGIPVK